MGMSRLTIPFLLSTLCLLLLSISTSAITIDLGSRRGVGVDDGLDDSAAIQAAFNDVLAAGGGTVIFPSGILDLNQQVSLVPEAINAMNLTLKGDGGSILRVSVGPKSSGLYFGNLNHLNIDNMIFIGQNVPIGNAKFIDAGIGIFAGFVAQTRITRTAFYGLAVPSGGAIIHASTGLMIESCQFGGVNAGFPEGAAVKIDCCSSNNQNASITGSTFLDYAYLKNEYLSKTPAFTGYWVRTKQTYYGGSTAGLRLSIDDTFFDEGAAVSVGAENIAALILKGLKVNISSSSPGTSIRATNVKRIRVEDSNFGYTQQPRPFAIITGSSAEMVGVQLRDNVQCPTVQSDTVITWQTSDCN
jgi:hypothetical protein